MTKSFLTTEAHLNMRIWLIISALAIISCSSKNTDDKLSVNSSPEEVVKNFYTWYLRDHYNKNSNILTPGHKISSDSIIYLDTTQYMSLIRKAGFFSSHYIKNEMALFGKCDQELRKIGYKELEECGCSPSEFTNNCGFMDYYPWLYHQGEDTEGITILNSEVTGENAHVQIGLLSKKGDTKPYQELEVSLSVEDSSWRINSIANGQR